MKTHILEIKSIYGKILYTYESDSPPTVKDAVEEAVKNRASLNGASGIHRDLITPLRFLLDQPGKIRAYKLTTAEGKSPIAPANGHLALTYEVGNFYEEMNANTDETKGCRQGINLATIDWCLKEWKDGYRIFICEFEAKDIAAIPIGSDGKFRVFRCTVVGEKNLNKMVAIVDPVEEPSEYEKYGVDSRFDKMD